MFNFNNNNVNLDALINNLRYPEKGIQIQKDFNQKRITRIEKAIAAQPLFIPLSFTLLAAGAISPFDLDTPLNNFDVILTGGITDAAVDRNFNLKTSYRDLPFTIVGENRTMYSKLSEMFGGNSAALNGQKGVFYYPSPILVKRNVRLTLDIYKTDVTADDELLNVVFTGFRANKYNPLDEEERKVIETYLNVRPSPKTVFLKQLINFDIAGVGGVAKNVYFPSIEEPLLIRGCKTNLTRSLITQIKLEGGTDWNTADLPIWAIGAEEQNEVDSYFWFQRPVYVPAKQVLELSLRNSINGIDFDAQTGNEITWICETV